MKRSDAAAISAGTLTALIIGITGSMLFPLAGLAAGAYFSAMAASGAGMGLAAAGALGAAGAVGGFALGRFSKPLAVWIGVALGIVAGGITKAVTAAAGFLFRAFSKRKFPPSAPAEKRPGIFGRIKSALQRLRPRFNVSAGKAANNQPPAAPVQGKEPPKPAL